MVIINVIDELRFSLNGNVYPRVFMANASGSDSLAIYGVNDKNNVLLKSTKYTEIQVDGTVHISRDATMSALVSVLYSGASGSGGGGSEIVNITQIPNRSYNDLQNLPDLSGGVAVTNTNNHVSKFTIATINGSPIEETVTELRAPVLNGDVLSLTYIDENNEEQTVTVNLGSLRTIPGGVDISFDSVSGDLTVTDAAGAAKTVNLSTYALTTSVDQATGDVHLMQDGTLRAVISKAGETGEYADLFNAPTNVSAFSNDAGYATETYVDNNIPTKGTILTNVDRTFVDADLEKTIVVYGASPVTLTLPEGLSDGFKVDVINVGTSTVTLSPQNTATLDAPADNYTLPAESYAGILKKTGADDFYMFDIAKPGGNIDPHTHTVSDITDFPTNVSTFTNDSGYITGISWSEVTSKPTEFTPEAHTHVVADITDFPTIPDSTNDLVNDSGFITSADVPTNVSELTNDSGYITNGDIPTNVSAFTNDAGYVTSAEVTNGIEGTLDVTSSRAFADSDNGKTLLVNSASAITLTITPSALSSDFTTNIINIGAGTLTIESTESPTISAPNGNEIPTDGIANIIKKTDNTTFYIYTGSGSGGSGSSGVGSDVKIINTSTYTLLESDTDVWLHFTVDCTVSIPTGLNKHEFEGDAADFRTITFDLVDSNTSTLRYDGYSQAVVGPNGVFGIKATALDNYVLFGTLKPF